MNGIKQEDPILQAEYIAETKLPTDVGQFKLRAYRIPSDNDDDFAAQQIMDSPSLEPCVIYSADHAFDKLAHNVPVRIHDQCLTSEVFGSQR